MPATALLATLLAATFVGAADSTPKFVAPKTIPELEARIRHVLDSAKVPGVGLAIVRHDSVVYAGGLGLARMSPAAPANATTLFRIGSTSKAFVALTAQALVREGKLKLDDKLSDRLPGFWFKNPWEATDPVRIVNLLEHTAGFDDNSLQSYANSDPTPVSLERGLAIDSATRVSRWRPGTRFSYCNTGPAIVARIIEIIEGKPFEQVIQDRWFTPIGMTTATYFRPDSSKLPVATLYRADGRTPVPYWHVFIRPAGSINASALDMAQYVRFLLGRGTINGRELLDSASIARMEQSGSSLASRSGITTTYGLHLYRTTDSTGFLWSSHNGGVEGGLSDMSYLAGDGVGYAFQVNSANGAAFGKITQLVRAYVTQGISPPARPAVAPVNATTRAQFAGWYHTVNPRQQHLYFFERLATLSRVSFTDTGFTIKPLLGKGESFVPVDSVRFRAAGEGAATLAFVHDEVNDRPRGIEASGAALGKSWEQVSGGQAMTNVVLVGLWILGLFVSVLVGLFIGVRGIVRRIWKRASRPSVARRAWGVAIAGTVAIVSAVVLLAVGSDSIQRIGTLTVVSGGSWALFLVFGALAVCGVVVAVRSGPPSTRWERVSLTTARVVLMLHAVAACYLAYWGVIGWRTWA